MSRERARQHMDDPTILHALSHGDRVRSMRYDRVIERVYARAGLEPAGPVECDECRQHADARMSFIMGSFFDGTGPFAAGAAMAAAMLREAAE